MSEPEVMQEQQGPEERKRHRSPAWPFISLERGVERIADLYRAHRDRALKPSAANVCWGMKVTSGAGPQTISALRQYGLMEDAYDGVKLSELGLRIVRDTREVSPDRDAALREAALRPSIFAEIRRNWEGPLPPDGDVEFYLVHQRDFSEESAKRLLSNYKATIRYAKLDGFGKDSSSDHRETAPTEALPPVKSGVSHQSPTKLMEGERIVFTHEIEPEHGVRILASGEVDDSTLDALELYIQLQRKRLERQRQQPNVSSEDRE